MMMMMMMMMRILAPAGASEAVTAA
jgi:hypothetical protein